MHFNIAVVGCGGMSAAWLNVVTKRSDCTIVALVDLIPQNAEQKKKDYKLDCPIFEKLEDALSQCSVNLVIDVTIPQAHFHTVTTALKAGCDVIGEKPMANSLEEAVKMLEVADQTGRNYAVMQNRRYMDFMIAFHKLTASGLLGNIGSLSADFFIGAHFGGFRDIMDSPLILDMAIHTFDSARFISGTDATSVYCQEFNPSWSWYKGAAAAVCIFEMSNGSVFDYRGSWCAEGMGTSWEANWRAVYEKGTAMLQDNVLRYAKIGDGDPGFVRDMPIVTPEIEPLALWQHDGCINDMLDHFQKGTRPQTDCRDNIKSIAMVYAAIESSKKGAKVKVTF